MLYMRRPNILNPSPSQVERIEKSHLRGEECAIHALIDKAQASSAPATDSDEGAPKGATYRIPRVFPMSSEVVCMDAAKEEAPKGKSRHFHPASDDLRQYTLLKFYELNAGAVQMLVDGQDENNDLPFSPGPNEHEISEFASSVPVACLRSAKLTSRVHSTQFTTSPTRSDRSC